MNINLTLFGQTIAFAIFVWFTMKFVWPPITAAMQARQKKIAEGLDAAGRAQRDLQLAQEKAAQTLRESKEQAAEILDKANKTANASSRKPSSKLVAKVSVCLPAQKLRLRLK